MQAPTPQKPAAVLVPRRLDDLVIDDEASFRHVGLYGDLKEILRRDGYEFRLLPASSEGRWDRALLLNLTFWASGDGGDVLVDEHLSADVVAHVAWHHLASLALPSPPSAEALFLGEAIASAFDVYLVGRLLGHAPRSTFLASQVPAMAEAAGAAGLSADGFEALLERIAGDPERAFEELRELLYDATNALFACSAATDGLNALAAFDGHPFAALLHHYELSNWVLYARAYVGRAPGPDERVRAVDQALRAEGAALAWLTSEWLTKTSRTT